MTHQINYSIIIPHHNTPDLLQRLVKSIPQRNDIEIIIVDDNSDVNKKSDIHRSDVTTIFIDKEHSKGAGKARNIGMDNAHGKWLLFADSDDFYKEGFIDILDEYKDDDIEMLFYNVESVYSNTLKPTEYNIITKRVIDKYDGSKESTDVLLYLVYNPWRRMVLSSYVRKYGFRFEEVAQGNDNLFSLELSYYTTKFKIEKRPVYVWTIYEGSIMHSKSNLQKLKGGLHCFAVRTIFNVMIGHPLWNIKSECGKCASLPLKFIYEINRKQPDFTFHALLYYVFNYPKIWFDAYKAVRLLRSFDV